MEDPVPRAWWPESSRDGRRVPLQTIRDQATGLCSRRTLAVASERMRAVGVGAFGAGMFHLMTHAFFKALMFLGSGSVIHAMSEEQDMRKMGGLKKHMPVTYWTFVCGWIAIIGIPPLAGFFSKKFKQVMFRTSIY